MSRSSQTTLPASVLHNESCDIGQHDKPVGASTILQPPHPSTTVPPRILFGDDRALRAAGHSQTCIELNRRGAISSCDCRIQPLPDSAVLISAIIRFVRRHRPGIRALPAHLTELLIQHLRESDPTCRVVANWLFAIGVRDSRILAAMCPRARYARRPAVLSTLHVESCDGGERHKPVGSTTAPKPSHPSPTVPPRILIGDDRTLRRVGHSKSCIKLRRHGAISSCDCKIQPVPDAAPLIGAIIRFVREHRRGIRALPSHLTDPLIRHLQEGDPSCQVVARWLFVIGVRDHRILVAMCPRAR